jgi:hypothetical protein
MIQSKSPEADVLDLPVLAELDRPIRWISRTPLVIGLVLVGLVGAYVVAFYANGWSKSPDAWGQFGDYIGGLLNPLVALCALVALVVSIQLQKVELAATRSELASAKEAAEEQALTARLQRREERFFDVLRLYQETLRSVAFERSTANGPLSFFGKSAFQFIASSQLRTAAGGGVVNALPSLLRERTDMTAADEQKILKALEDWSPLLDHYFRVIFLLLREAEPTLGDEHFRYVKYLRAQLSRDELQLLTLNMIFDAEGKKMIPWAEKYGLLKHLPPGRLRAFAEMKLPGKVFGSTWFKKKGT